MAAGVERIRKHWVAALLLGIVLVLLAIGLAIAATRWLFGRGARRSDVPHPR